MATEPSARSATTDGVVVLPYGNGAERTLGNEDLGASIHRLRFNEHTQAHLLRAAQEGIAFALRYGVDIMRDMGLSVDTVRAGHGNMFLSPLFASAFATTTGATVELVTTDGAEGAARGAGLGMDVYATPDEAFDGLAVADTIRPDPDTTDAYDRAYERWLEVLQAELQSVAG